MKNFKWAHLPDTLERGKAFAKITGLVPSGAWGALLTCSGRGCFGIPSQALIGIPGADHTHTWRFPHKRGWIVTTEPYRSADHNFGRLAEFCETDGWSMLLSVWPGIWNPPHTRLILLSPPRHGISVIDVERLLTTES